MKEPPKVIKKIIKTLEEDDTEIIGMMSILYNRKGEFHVLCVGDVDDLFLEHLEVLAIHTEKYKKDTLFPFNKEANA